MVLRTELEFKSYGTHASVSRLRVTTQPLSIKHPTTGHTDAVQSVSQSVSQSVGSTLGR
jgi:hypothetical protein